MEHVPAPPLDTHTLLALQTWFAPQLPQLSMLPQPSLIDPHVLPCAEQVVGTQAAPPITSATVFTTTRPAACSLCKKSRKALKSARVCEY